MTIRAPLTLLLTLMVAAPVTASRRDEVHARHVEQARQLRQFYLDRGFIATLPVARDGRALGVAGARRSTFGLSGAPSISGELRIERLEGRMRLSLLRTRDALKYGRTARVSGTASVTQGRLLVYSRMTADPWNMARALLDTASSRPPPEDFRLEGWTVTEIPAGQTMAFNAQLLTMGGDYMLVLEAPDGAAEGIRLVLDGR
jgi:hypothetical protein